MVLLAQRALRFLLHALVGLGKLIVLAYCCLRAYRIRMHPVTKYGYIIHEFDPWFNYRAAEYLAERGWHSFFHWYDYMSWYPLGRPVGTTIYPGMQIAAVAIWRALQWVPTARWRIPKEVFRYLPAGARGFFPARGHLAVGPMTLNEVCCTMPAWFGALATVFLALLTAEASGSTGAGLAAACIMAIIPAHLMRSMAGGFDNECVAVATFCMTFWLWCRALRTPRSWPFGLFAGIAYVFAVATWGGYIFVNNLIGLHAAVIVALGRYNSGVYRAFTLWYVVGTVGATFVPVVGWTPLRSLEQMPSFLVFVTFQLMEGCEFMRRRRKGGMAPWKFFFFRVQVFAAVLAVAFGVCFILSQLGYFAPLGSRIRGLFLKHQKTGNPLVDSVAEHRPGTAAAYEAMLHDARYLAVVGLLFCWHQGSPAKFFPIVYAAVAYHFSLKMSRLMVICGPVVSMLAGYPVGIILDWCLEQFVALPCGRREPTAAEDLPVRSGGMGSIFRCLWSPLRLVVIPQELRDVCRMKDDLQHRMPKLDRLCRALLAVAILAASWKRSSEPARSFIRHCDERAEKMGNPRIVFQTTMQNGQSVTVDDYYVGYKWLRDNTPEDARIMAWWDYGYQITGVANRTSLADGNTWNHEHIATIGRTLTAPEKRAYNVMRHIADYVLVWAGGQGDDVAKSHHMARIANSVFPDVCGGDDPTCREFGLIRQGVPAPMMAKSFLYRAVNHETQPGVSLSSKRFREVYKSKHGLLRIFQVLNVSQESKDWVANPANRICDAPGSWYCTGQYPPALDKLIAMRKNFAQLEDFNKQGQEKSAYTKMVEESARSGRATEF